MTGARNVFDLKISQQYKPYLRIGTCSWKYDSWANPGLYDISNNGE